MCCLERLRRSQVGLALSVLVSCAGPQAPPARAAEPVVTVPPPAPAPAAIPNTQVLESALAREAIEVCERYRKAIEKRDVEALLALASRGYHDEGAAGDRSDDLHWGGLRDYLTGQFQNVTDIRYEIRYRAVRGDEDSVTVVFTYSASYTMPAATPSIRRVVQDNRLELRRENGVLKIVSGM